MLPLRRADSPARVLGLHPHLEFCTAKPEPVGKKALGSGHLLPKVAVIRVRRIT